jgi:hypothetical protein
MYVQSSDITVLASFVLGSFMVYPQYALFGFVMSLVSIVMCHTRILDCIHYFPFYSFQTVFVLSTDVDVDANLPWSPFFFT